MKLVTFFVCNNGFGHYKRCARIAYFLARTNERVKINFICNEKALLFTSNWYITEFIIKNPRLNFIAGKNTIRLSKGDSNNEVLIDSLDWLDRELLNKSDLVISDNVSLILKLKPDTVLMGSFLWSEVLKGFAPQDKIISQFCESELSLLKKYRPIMIAHRDMAMSYIRKYTNFFPTSWVVDEEVKPENKIGFKIENILIIGGGTGKVDHYLVEIINQLSGIDKYKVHISERLEGKVSLKSNCSVFGFTKSDFLNIDLMICRPGLGSITDAVTYSIPILGIQEEINNEIEFNLQKIEELQFGINITNRVNEIEAILNELKENKLYEKFRNSLANSEKNGVMETVDFLTERFNL